MKQKTLSTFLTVIFLFVSLDEAHSFSLNLGLSGGLGASMSGGYGGYGLGGGGCPVLPMPPMVYNHPHDRKDDYSRKISNKRRRLERLKRELKKVLSRLSAAERFIDESFKEEYVTDIKEYYVGNLSCGGGYYVFWDSILLGPKQQTPQRSSTPDRMPAGNGGGGFRIGAEASLGASLTIGESVPAYQQPSYPPEYEQCDETCEGYEYTEPEPHYEEPCEGICRCSGRGGLRPVCRYRAGFLQKKTSPHRCRSALDDFGSLTSEQISLQQEIEVLEEEIEDLRYREESDDGYDRRGGYPPMAMPYPHGGGGYGHGGGGGFGGLLQTVAQVGLGIYGIHQQNKLQKKLAAQNARLGWPAPYGPYGASGFGANVGFGMGLGGGFGGGYPGMMGGFPGMGFPGGSPFGSILPHMGGGGMGCGGGSGMGGSNLGMLAMMQMMQQQQGFGMGPGYQMGGGHFGPQFGQQGFVRPVNGITTLPGGVPARVQGSALVTPLAPSPVFGGGFNGGVFGASPLGLQPVGGASVPIGLQGQGFTPNPVNTSPFPR